MTNFQELTFQFGTAYQKIHANIDPILPFNTNNKEYVSQVLGTKRKYAFISPWDVYEMLPGNDADKCAILAKIEMPVKMELLSGFATRGSQYIEFLNSG